MKSNIYFRSLFTSILVVVVLCIMIFPVCAEQIGTNDYFDYDTYSQYDLQGDTVNVITTLPDWYVTFVNTRGSDLVVSDSSFGNNVTFTIQKIDDVQSSFSLYGCPFGINGYYSTSNYVYNGHFFDLYKMPESFVMTGGCTINHSSLPSHGAPDMPFYTVKFVDDNGQIISSVDLTTDYINDYYNGVYVMEYSFTFDTSTRRIPDNARGFYITFDYVGSLNYAGMYDFHVTYSPFVMSFSVDDAFINFRNQEIIRDELSNINDVLGDLTNGTPAQNQQAQDSIDDLKGSTDKLDQLGDTLSSVEKPSINSNQISAGSLVPHTSLVVLSSPFQALWENRQLLAMLTIVVTLVLVSWVFFGKKG